jgi:hypothetical protein
LAVLPPVAAVSPITALGVGEDGIVWAGDADGRFLAVAYEPTSHSVGVICLVCRFAQESGWGFVGGYSHVLLMLHTEA